MPITEGHYHSDHPAQVDIEEFLKKINSDEHNKRQKRKRKAPAHH